MIRISLLGFVLLGLTACLQTRQAIREKDTRKETQQVVVTQQQLRAQETSRAEEVDGQFRQVNGRLDLIENHLSQLSAANETAKRSEDGDTRFRAYEEALKKLEMQLIEVSNELKDLKKNEKPALSKGKEPSSFELAESLFTKKEWKEAIVSYQKYRDDNPKGKNYAEATYKIGVAFQELKMKSEARAFFEEVLAKFPKSKEAKKAEFRLKNLKT